MITIVADDPGEDHAATAAVGEVGEAGEMAGHAARPFSWETRFRAERFKCRNDS